MLLPMIFLSIFSSLLGPNFGKQVSITGQQYCGNNPILACSAFYGWLFYLHNQKMSERLVMLFTVGTWPLHHASDQISIHSFSNGTLQEVLLLSELSNCHMLDCDGNLKQLFTKDVGRFLSSHGRSGIWNNSPWRRFEGHVTRRQVLCVRMRKFQKYSRNSASHSQLSLPWPKATPWNKSKKPKKTNLLTEASKGC